MSEALCLIDVAARADGNVAEASSVTGLLDELLSAQQRTAVDQFSQWHQRNSSPLHGQRYRDLIPRHGPGVGEQYAFEVNLDACSGCKACVVACHNLNGLEESETWRSVGLLHGGTTALPVLQHVTTACHHCLEPACLDGCPVNAYEKDALTGIVRHLDDQCIGCQYCVLKCPYDVPKYSHAKGIVRKCDMCHDRLAAGEAPACVQACPQHAIRITLVSRHEAAENAEANLFLPGAPEPGYTLPTTVYKSSKPLATNLLPADYFAAAPQHAHWSLIWMLVLTQMSVGAFCVDQLLLASHLFANHDTATADGGWHLVATFGLGLLGLAAATFHLGRPHLAYRAIIGWRTSWLSREVICFGAFAALASLYAAVPWLETGGLVVSETMRRTLGGLVAATGLGGVLCSAMIYASTRRAFWTAALTGAKFFLTCAVLGVPLALLIRFTTTTSFVARELVFGLIGAAVAKLLIEVAIFRWLTAKTLTPLRRTAILMTGVLARTTTWRFLIGAVGGVVLPLVLLTLAANDLSVAASPSPWKIGGLMLVTLGANFAAEVLERYLFFAAVVAPKMPGATA